jgi:hypothetical protein
LRISGSCGGSFRRANPAQLSCRTGPPFYKGWNCVQFHPMLCRAGRYNYYAAAGLAESGSSKAPASEYTILLSVADPGCLSRIRIFSHPGSWIKKQQQKRGVKKNFSHTFLSSHKFHKIENYFSFEVLKKKICANFQRIIELFTKRIVTKLSKIWFWDPGSGKNLSRIQGSKRHRIPDPDPQH